jgi:hypothetical protein
MFARSTVLLYLLGTSSAQSIPNFTDTMSAMMAAKNLTESVKAVMDPIKQHLEPFKVHEATRERGVPVVHEELGKLLSI